MSYNRYTQNLIVEYNDKLRAINYRINNLEAGLQAEAKRLEDILERLKLELAGGK